MRAPKRREWTLLLLASGVIFASAESYRSEPVDKISTPRKVSALPGKPEAHLLIDTGDLSLPPLRPEAELDETADLFASTSWYVAPAAPPAPVMVALPPPTPTAPPMPFGYLGRYQDAAKPIIFLTRSDRVLLVSEGDVIEGAYRVDGIVGSRLGLTYLPLNIRQSLDIGPTE